MKAAICVATNRPETIPKWLEAWGDEFDGCPVIIVEDGPEKTVDFSESTRIWRYCWKNIDKDLGEDSWIIPRRSVGIKSYGLLKAAELKPNVIIMLDDDCFPLKNEFVESHVRKLSSYTISDGWVSTLDGCKPRGMPYQKTYRTMPCVINHGMWRGRSDLDAVTRLTADSEGLSREEDIPRGMYYPMCNMNLAFRVDMLPAMYQLLMGPDYEYDRFDDIWSGIFSKRICDHLGRGVGCGRPCVNHQSESNVWDNLRKEVPGMEINERLWRCVDEIILTKETVADCYLELAEKLPMPDEEYHRHRIGSRHGEPGYWHRLKRAMKIWVNLTLPLIS